jgi:hypothetical protein
LAAEGLSTEISRVFDTTGLVGSLSSTVNWGDNTQTTGTVSGAVDNAGPLSIKFEYLGSFFNDEARRTLLRNAAASVIERFSDDLEAIQPTSFLRWTAVTTNPTNGQELTVQDLAVAQNQLVIYVGARGLSTPNNPQVGEASVGFARTSYPGLYTQEELAQINAWQDRLQYRGEDGARGANPTDIGPWGGSITFDSNTNWHFGATTDDLGDDEVDFSTVVVHELMHVLGFGVNYEGSANSSFETFRSGLTFTGPKTRALYGGNVPLENIGHFADEVTSNGQQSVITPNVGKGIRKVITPLDIASLDDIGWTVRAAPNATVTASHIYADNPDSGTTYPVEVVLRGSQFGEVTQSLTTTVANTPPTLSVSSSRTIQLGDEINIVNLGRITDPGFSSAAAGTTESFTYSINWGDGTTDTGDARTDANGSAGTATRASFGGSHVYTAAGSYTVTVTARDDDGGATTETFNVTVTSPPVLRVALSRSRINENDGIGASTLSVTRTGPTNDPLVVSFVSSDTSEATIRSSLTIPAGESTVSTPINAVDDALLDSTQTASIGVTAPRTIGSEIELQVLDVESLSASFIGGNILEAESTSVVLRVTRSNTDTETPLAVTIAGGTASQLIVPSDITIAAGRQSVDVELTPVQNETAEANVILDYVISSENYTRANASVALLDDESPYFQNHVSRFNSDGSTDASGNPTITPNDILVVINELFAEGGDAVLNPNTRPFLGIYYDVDGNGTLSPNDIKEVIDELARVREATGGPSGEQIVARAQFVSDVLNTGSDFDDEENEEQLSLLLNSTTLY